MANLREGIPVSRKSWAAAVLSLAMPGLGQLYNGEPLKAFSVFIFVVLIPVFSLKSTVYLPDGFLLAGVVASMLLTITIYVGAAVEAYRKAAGYADGYSLKPVNRGYLYVSVWILGTFLIMAAVGHTRRSSVHAFKIVTASMSPAVLEKDFVLVDRSAYRRMAPKVGDVVVYVFPDDRSKFFISRISGLPGDMVELNGEMATVPHGVAYMLRDKAGKPSYDSRDFGFVPLRDIVGKARQIYFSLGALGVRWDRVGMTLDRLPPPTA